MKEEYRNNLDTLQEKKTRSYDRFEEHGKAFIDVMSDGVPELEDEVWISADEILEASEKNKADFKETSGNRVFTSIYNLLCDVEILSAFHDSPPYEIRPNSYDEEEVIDAWEYVSGDEYHDEQEEDTRNLEDKPPEEVDDLYQEVKD